MIQELPSAFYHYRHQTGWHQLEIEAYSTMVCNSSTKEWFHQKSKGNYAYKYSNMLTETYLEILGRVACPE